MRRPWPNSAHSSNVIVFAVLTVRRSPGLPEDAWMGTLETQWIDKRDAKGNILTALAQRILNSDGDSLRVFSVQGELETVADGAPVIVTGYRVGSRVLVTGVSHPPLDEVP